jgi:hypothetical protein
MPKGFVTTADAAAKSGLSLRRIQQLCKAGLIPGAQEFAGVWMVPASFKRKRQKPGPKSKK